MYLEPQPLSQLYQDRTKYSEKQELETTGKIHMLMKIMRCDLELQSSYLMDVAVRLFNELVYNLLINVSICKVFYQAIFFSLHRKERIAL